MLKYLLSTLPSEQSALLRKSQRFRPMFRAFASSRLRQRDSTRSRRPPKSYSSHGFRPSPSRPRMPKLFEVWQKAVTNGKTNVQPTLERTVNLLNLRKSCPNAACGQQCDCYLFVKLKWAGHLLCEQALRQFIHSRRRCPSRGRPLGRATVLGIIPVNRSGSMGSAIMT